MLTYLLSLPIDPMRVGQAYENLPLHCSLLQLFQVPERTDGLARGLATVLGRQKPVYLAPGERDLFGPNSDVPVIRVENRPELRSMHQLALRFLVHDCGASLCNPKWAGDGYNPHVSDLSDRTFADAVGPTVVDQVLLIRKTPAAKYVAAEIRLGR